MDNLNETYRIIYEQGKRDGRAEAMAEFGSGQLQPEPFEGAEQAAKNAKDRHARQTFAQYMNDVFNGMN